MRSSRWTRCRPTRSIAARKAWVVGPYSYYNQFRYNPNNEPDLHSPWLYTLIGQPWKTAAVVRAAQQLFTNAPNGVTGNDDLGTMSAWYLFSAIGVYPAVPGSGQFLLHTPRFSKVEVDMGNGRTLRIDAPGADGRRLQYVQGVQVDGQAHAPVWLDWNRCSRARACVCAGREGAGAGLGHGGEGPAGVLVRGTGQPAALSRTVPFAATQRTARHDTALIH
jgi:hypothetical protein